MIILTIFIKISYCIFLIYNFLCFNDTCLVLLITYLLAVVVVVHLLVYLFVCFLLM